MKTLCEHLKQFFLLICFFALTATAVEAQDLNATLIGTYATHTNWGCTHFDPNDPSGAPNGNAQLTTAGEISYFGDGTAEEVGHVGVTDHHIRFGNLGRYECTWTYEVNDDPDLDCNDAGPHPVLGATPCEFKYEGSCDTNSIAGFVKTIDQVWYGRIGVTDKATKEKKGAAVKGLNTDVLLIERHDGNPERDNDDPDSPFNICSKNGTQIKISDTPKDLIPE